MSAGSETVKLGKTLGKVYEKMHARGDTSPLGLTLKVTTDGRQEKFFYDVKVRDMDDPNGLLDEYKVTGVIDKGYYTQYRDEETGKKYQLWTKNMVEVTEPRYLETFVREYGIENVVIHEFGKYYHDMQEVMNILAGL